MSRTKRCERATAFRLDVVVLMEVELLLLLGRSKALRLGWLGGLSASQRGPGPRPESCCPPLAHRQVRALHGYAAVDSSLSPLGLGASGGVTPLLGPHPSNPGWGSSEGATPPASVSRPLLIPSLPRLKTVV